MASSRKTTTHDDEAKGDKAAAKTATATAEKPKSPLDKAEMRRRAREMLASKGDADNEMLEDTSRGDPDAPYSCLAYGPAGVGKSTFFSRRRNVYFIPVEPGVNQIRVPQYRHEVDSLATVYAILEKLRTSRHPYEAVCLDSASATERLIVAAIDGRLAQTPIKLRNGSLAHNISEWNDEYSGGISAVGDEWAELLRRLDRLRTERAMDTFVTAHAKTETVKNIEGPDYQKYTIDLTGQKSIKTLVNWSEYTLFMRQDFLIDASKKKVLASTSALSMYTRGTVAWVAKTRGEIPWPERLPLDWRIFDQVRDMVARHGGGIVPWLVARLGDRPETAPGTPVRRILDGELAARQYHVCDDLCSLVERFAAVEPTIPEARRPKAREVFFGALAERRNPVAEALCRQAEAAAASGRQPPQEAEPDDVELDSGPTGPVESVDADGVVTTVATPASA